MTSRPNLKLLKTYQDLKIDTVKIQLLIKIRWMWITNLTISKTKVNGKLLLPEINGHSTNAGKVTLERNRKSNDIYFKLSNRFSPLHVDQNLTRPTSTIPNIPEKIPTNSRNTSLHTTNTMWNKRPLVCTNENYLKNFIAFTVPGNSDYASVIKNGRKVFVVGYSHIKRIRRNDFNKELKNGKAIFQSFSGADTKQLDHYILPPLVDDKPDAVIIHVGTNDILTNANHEEIARNIIKTGLNCKNHGVNDVVISSVLVKKNPNLNALIRRVNDLLCDLWSMNGFGYICNDAITTEYLWKDGIHLQDLGTNILSSNFITFVNSFLIDNDNNRFWLNHSHQTNDLKFGSDLEGLINLRRAYQNNPLIAYLNINSLREKIISLREILKKTKIDVLCIDETKLDSSFPNHQFKIEGYQFPPLRRDRNSKGGREMVFVWEGFIASKWKTLKRKTLKLYVLNLPLLRKSDAFFLLTVPQTLIKKNFLMKFQLALIKY